VTDVCATVTDAEIQHEPSRRILPMKKTRALAAGAVLALALGAAACGDDDDDDAPADDDTELTVVEDT